MRRGAPAEGQPRAESPGAEDVWGSDTLYDSVC
jgi:hypothetical protein